MPRPFRIHAPDGFYHVTLRGNHRQAIFTQDSERTLLNMIVARAIEKHRARLHAYCWMTNHLHLIVQVSVPPLGKVIQQIASQYARAFQLRLETTGHLFENRYHATLIDTDAYLLEALRYVHQNPVRAGLVPAVSHYRWSSHAAYLRAAGDSMVTTDFALALLSPDRARHAPQPQVPAALEIMIEDACSHFGVTRVELRSPRRLARLVAARTWIAHSAINSGAITLAAVARALNRDAASLRSAIRNHTADDRGLIDNSAWFSLPDTTS